MSLSNLQLNWLRTFEAVGRHMSFSDAADELNMSQSAVSQQIRLLENKLGKDLFVRKTRSIQLTIAGRAYLSVVREGLWHIHQGVVNIFSSVAQGVLEISVNNSFAQLWLAPRMSRFTALYPQISLRIYGVNWEADAPPSKAELDIRYGLGNWPQYDITPLISSILRPYCSNAIASRLKESGSDFMDFPLIDVLGTPSGWSDWLATHPHNESESYQRYYVDSYGIAVSMAIEGAGICLLNEELIEMSTLRGQLGSPTPLSIDSHARFFLLKPFNKPLSAAAQAFCSWLEMELR
ncbi:LysR family transcriptional regulator [Pseudomonas sp. Pseusp3]|uniref:LysR family transcriptional regulator n=1 Tax=unclassified Pseudomonas TaxID=196821 RepID=UPI0039B07203